MSQNTTVDLLKSLSSRQKQVLSLLLDGYDCSDIASKLEIKKATASGHIKEVYQIFENHGYCFDGRYLKHAKLVSLLRRTDFEKQLNLSLLTINL